MEEKNKKIDMLLKIILVTLTMLLVFVIGFVTYHKVFNKSNGNETNNDITSKEYTQTDFDEIVTEWLGLSTLLNKQSLSEMTNQERLRMIISEYTGEDKYTSFNQSALEKVHRESIISDLEINHENLYDYYGTFLWNTESMGYEYDNSVGTFTYTGNLGHGANSKANIINKELIGFDKVDDIYTVKYKYIFYNSLGDGPNDIDLYLSIDDALNEKNAWVHLPIDVIEQNNENGEKEVVNTNHEKEYISEHYDEVKDNLSIYTYIFKVVNNHLVITDFSVA